MTEKTTGIYIHIPFCLSKCPYCDFCSKVPSKGEIGEYIRSLLSHIESYREPLRGYSADTVYFGGGTPTLLDPSQYALILDKVNDIAQISDGAEITSECNPATADACKFKAMLKAGVNRLSIGVQSLNDGELKLLGRIHDAAEAVRTYYEAREAGFGNINVDLMYGICGQTRNGWRETFERVTEHDPEHISAYCLKVEENTPYGEKGDALDLPDDDEVADMYGDFVAAAESRGIYRYEISNFAKKGFESRHNLKYWRCEEYIGFGVSAHSYFKGQRYAAPKDLGRYAKGEYRNGGSDVGGVAGESERETEYVMLAMRLSEGLNIKKYSREFSRDPRLKYEKRFEKYVSAGLVLRDEDGWRFTTKGMLLSNVVLSDILDF